MVTGHVLFSFIVVVLVATPTARCLPLNARNRLVCAPGESFKMDCNWCRCSPDGTRFGCTLMACPPIENYKNSLDTSMNKRAIIKPWANYQRDDYLLDFTRSKRDVPSFYDQDKVAGDQRDESYLDQLQQHRLQYQQHIADQQREAAELADQKQILQQQTTDMKNQLELQGAMDQLQRLLDAAQQELDTEQAQQDQDEYYGFDVDDYGDLQQEAAIDFKKVY